MKLNKIYKIWSVVSRNTEHELKFEVANMLDPEVKRVMDLGFSVITDIDVDIDQNERVYLITYSNDTHTTVPANLFGADYAWRDV